ncbi:MAG: response regulator [Nitrospiraceae bacterium]|nr:MAG: response regulator [Nitrospiraceae bacterium]
MIREKRHLIAIVDDEPNSLKAMRRQLMDSYDVATFNSADELLGSLHKISPSLFILDWLMPGKDGISLCRDIRKMHRFDLVPIAFYSGIDPSTSNIQKAHEAGAQTFIPKASFSSFTLMHIDTLVDGYDRMSRYLRHQKTMLSVLKHDMSNLLTGIITGMHVLLMDDYFKNDQVREETNTITQACDKLLTLFGDLSEVIVDNDRNINKPLPCVKVTEIRASLHNSLRDIMRKVIIEFPDTLELACDPVATARAIHYMVRFVDKTVSQHIDLLIRSGMGESGVTFTISLHGNFKECLESSLINILDLENYDDRHDLLAVQYFQNYLNQNNTDISIIYNGTATEISFLVPQQSQDQHSQAQPDTVFSSCAAEDISVSPL